MRGCRRCCAPHRSRTSRCAPPPAAAGGSTGWRRQRLQQRWRWRRAQQHRSSCSPTYPLATATATQTTRASDDPQQNNIAHTFLSTKSAVLEGVFRMLSLLLPDSLWTFSGAKYCCQGHIKPHDDRAYTQVSKPWRVWLCSVCGVCRLWERLTHVCQRSARAADSRVPAVARAAGARTSHVNVLCAPSPPSACKQVRMEDGSIQLCSRNIAVIFYLTKVGVACVWGGLAGGGGGGIRRHSKAAQ